MHEVEHLESCFPGEGSEAMAWIPEVGSSDCSQISGLESRVGHDLNPSPNDDEQKECVMDSHALVSHFDLGLAHRPSVAPVLIDWGAIDKVVDAGFMQF